jgi:hypothetical protein
MRPDSDREILVSRRPASARTPASVARGADLLLSGVGSGALAAARWLELRDGALWIPGWRRALPCWCPFRCATGFDCPLCGLSRSFVAAAHGDLAASLRCHPAGALLAAAVLAMLLGIGAAAVRGRRPLSGRPGFQRASLWLAALCLLAGAARTCDGGP